MDKELIFLVVLDDSDEVLNALRYASQRSSINNGRVALLYTFETLEFSHWKAVEDIAEVESRAKKDRVHGYSTTGLSSLMRDMPLASDFEIAKCIKSNYGETL